MSRARFVADHHHGLTCEAFGRKFPHNAWVDVDDLAPEHVLTLAANPTFDVEVKAPKPAKGPKAADGPGSDATATDA